MRLSHALVPLAALAFAATFVAPQPANASSHREAPGIATNPVADNTDVYFFVSPTDPSKAVLVGCWWPIEDPAGGPNYFHFGDDVDYAFHVDNDGDAKADISYVFRFKTDFQNPQSALYATGPISSLDDADWNYRQSYKVIRAKQGEGRETIAENLRVPPVNIGPRTTPSYDDLADDTFYSIGEGVQVFAGQRDDPFFVDLGAIFDLISFRAVPGNTGQGLDDLAGYNCQAIVLEIPIDQLTNDGSNPADPADPAAILGIWSTSVQKHRHSNGDDSPFSAVAFDEEDVSTLATSKRQVSRLGMPLVNEVVIPIGLKDRWNRSAPQNDGQFLSYVQDPELARIFEALYGITKPPTPRCDLVAVFLTGVPGLNQPPNVVGAEELRLNVAIKPDGVPDSRFGVLGGDLDGFPNGRRLADDVVDIAERVVAGVLYPMFCDATFVPHALASQLGDGVDQNDAAFSHKFPYLASPNQGWQHDHHRIEPAHDPQRMGRVTEIGAVTLESGTALAATSGVAPSRFELAAPRPNPLAVGSNLSFRVPEKSRVSLQVFDVAGRSVRTLVDAEVDAGEHVTAWDGADDAGQRVASGIYLVQLTTPGEKASRKLTVLK